jgi:hypothetical protein
MPLDSHPEKIADSIANSAASIGISVSQFRRKYIATGLVVPVDLGGRSPSVLQAELRAAVAKHAAEQAADPTKKAARSGGAVLKARHRIGNPWGRHGKPAEAKSPSKGKTAKRIGE